MIFSPLDPHLLFFAANTLWQTRDGGKNWSEISPDLTRKTWEIPASVGEFRDRPSAQPRQRGVIYTVAPSPLDKNRVWAGTDDGLIHLTTDGGKTWRNVTPPQIGAWWKISLMDASHFDAKTAYAAVNTIRLDDLRPHIYRTNDDGKTWQEIVHGLPDDENVNVVREDPERRGLLFAGTERGVYLSFDNGDNWQSLRLNLPATSVRDLIVKDDDLCIATHGRGFWILDNITPLRQLQPEQASTAQLFKPQTAMRVRWNTNTDTPASARRAGGRESARRGNDRLFVRRRRLRCGHARDQGREWETRSPVFEQRTGGDAGAEVKNSALLGATAASSYRLSQGCIGFSGICTPSRSPVSSRNIR